MTRFGALVPREPAAEEREREFRAALERRGAELVLSVAYDPGERDFRKLLELLAESGCEAVYAPGEATDLEALLPQLEFYEFPARIVGHGGWTSPRVFGAGTRSLEGAILAVETADDPDSDFARHLKSAVEEIEEAEPTRFHAQGYRSMAAVLFAIDLGASSPEALGEALRLRAAWSDRPEGERIRLLTVRDGALAPADPDNLRPAPPETPAVPPGSGG
jgi:ABC-type branched-subunit amino acid transport system substrate-binding protein